MKSHAVQSRASQALFVRLSIASVLGVPLRCVIRLNESSRPRVDASSPAAGELPVDHHLEPAAARRLPGRRGCLRRSRVGTGWEPPVGIEPTTYSLRVNRSTD